MTRLLPRIARLEAAAHILPARIRQWLGEPVSPAEIARDDRDTLTFPDDATSGEFPPHLQQWLAERI